MTNRRPKRLNTAREVLDFLGSRWVKEVTGRSDNNLSDWRARDRIAPTLYLLMSRELERRGATASARLWGQEERRRAA